jgi:hypothetical protein
VEITYETIAIWLWSLNQVLIEQHLMRSTPTPTSSCGILNLQILIEHLVTCIRNYELFN